MMEQLDYYFWDEEKQVENSNHAFPSEDIWDKFQLVRFLPTSPPQGVDSSRRVWSTWSSLDDDVDWIHQFIQRDQDIDQEDQFYKQTRVRESSHDVSSLSEDLDCVDPNDVLSFPGISGCETQESSSSDSQMDASDNKNYTAEETMELDVEDEQQEDSPCQLVDSEIPAITAEQHDFVDPSMTSFDSFILQQQPDYMMPTPDTLIPAAEVPLSNIIQEAFIQAVQPQQDTSLFHPWPAAAFSSHSSNLTAFTAPSQTVFPPSSLSYSQCPPQDPQSLPHVTNPQFFEQNTHEHYDQDFIGRKRQSDLREFFRCLARYPMSPVTRNEVLLRLLQRLLQRTEELTAS